MEKKVDPPAVSRSAAARQALTTCAGWAAMEPVRERAAKGAFPELRAPRSLQCCCWSLRLMRCAAQELAPGQVRPHLDQWISLASLARSSEQLPKDSGAMASGKAAGKWIAEVLLLPLTLESTFLQGTLEIPIRACELQGQKNAVTASAML